MTILHILFRIVQRAACDSHKDRQQLARQDNAGQESAQRLDLEDHAHQQWQANRQRHQAHQFLLGGGGSNIHDFAIVGRGGSFQHARELELAANLVHHQVRTTGHGPQRVGREEEGQRPTQQEADGAVEA